MNCEELINIITEQQKTIDSLLLWQSDVNKICKALIESVNDNIEKINFQEELLKQIKEIAVANRWRIESLPYELKDTDYDDGVFKPTILSKSKTRELIIEEHKSISRFGDAEFAIACNIQRWNYQRVDKRLAEKLLNILKNAENDFLIGLNPSFYMNLGNIPEESADSVRSYMRPAIRRQHAQLLDRNRIYVDALLHNIDSKDDLMEIKKIWNNRECVFVEGCLTRMGVGNDLFNNCKKISRILGPATNAFDRYDDIFAEVLKQPKASLILIAMGQTATALAYDLYKEGYQAIDIGRIDLIYEKYLAGLDSLYNLRIPYKFCNIDEIENGREISDIDDAQYNDQIIARIY